MCVCFRVLWCCGQHVLLCAVVLDEFMTKARPNVCETLFEGCIGGSAFFSLLRRLRRLCAHEQLERKGGKGAGDRDEQVSSRLPSGRFLRGIFSTDATSVLCCIFL